MGALLGIAGLIFGPATGPAARDSTGTITATVEEPTGFPVPFANVIVPGTRTGTQTDGNGRFTMAQMPPGVWVLEVHALGYETLRRNVKVRSGGSAEVRLILSEHPSRERVPSLRGLGRWPPRLDPALRRGMIEATDVEAFRLGLSAPHAPGSEPADRRDFLGHYPIVDRVAPHPPWANDLIAALDHDELFVRPAKGEKMLCGFNPILAARFRGSEDAVEVLICYRCGEFIVRDGKRPEQWGFLEGLGGPFVELAQRAFPADPVIQSLSATPP